MPESASGLAEEVVAAMGHEGPAAREQVAGLLSRASEAYPELPAMPAEAWVACLAAVGARDPSQLEGLDAGEVLLATACAQGNAKAAAIFDAQYVSRLVPALRALGLDDAATQDVQQRVHQRLLTSDEAGRIRLCEYVGKGRLFGLVKVVAIRMAVDDIRRHKRAPDGRSADERTVARVMDGTLGPELAAIEEQHRGAVKTAFEAAVRQLAPKDRTILRLHLLEGSSIDEIAALHDVHRATAARWIVRIREGLAAAARKALQAELAVDESRFASLFHAVDSRIDLSLSRLLAPSSASIDAADSVS